MCDPWVNRSDERARAQRGKAAAVTTTHYPPGAEDVDVVEDVGLAEVEERPELLEGVLDGRAREEEARLGGDLLELVEELPVAVLDPLALVHL